MVGILAVSTAAIWIRLAIASAGLRGVGFSLVLAATRLTMASVLLIPTWHRVRWQQIPSGAIFYACAAGAILALHFAAWITSLSYTSIAAATTLVNTNSLWIALLSWLCFGEKPTWRMGLGMGIALTGGILIGWGSAAGTAVGSHPLFGNVLALAGAWAVSAYLLLGREAQQRGLEFGGLRDRRLRDGGIGVAAVAGTVRGELCGISPGRVPVDSVNRTLAAIGGSHEY